MKQQMEWLEPIYKQLESSIQEHQTTHAFLIKGQTGVGKNNLAMHLANGFLGEEMIKLTNNERDERIIPDCKLISPEENKETISIDQIRSLKSFLLLTSLKGHGKVGIINPADSMTYPAVNSLLKILEEPPEDTLLILLTDSINKLPNTIVSRVQIITVENPTKQQTLEWLNNSNEAENWNDIINIFGCRPVLLNKLGHTYLSERIETVSNELHRLLTKKIKPSQLANSWKSEELEINLRLVYYWFSKFLYHHLLETDNHDLMPKSLQELLGMDINIEESFNLLNEIASIRQLKINGKSLNWSLQITNLLNPIYSNMKGLQSFESRT
jgi:DNA polymerase-3 subunit delta'